MNYLKRNKKTIIAIGVFLLMVIVLGQTKKIFFPDQAKAIYGNRLDGIEKVTIKKDIETDIKAQLSDAKVDKVSYRLSGKTVEVKLTVTTEAIVDEAKAYGNKVLEAFTTEQKAYYDFQIFISCEKESTQFPIIGYKHHNKEALTWTKNRS